MKKECQYILLPTKHLYILSDDEIKEGDWYYSAVLNEIFKCEDRINLIDVCKKIIATSNLELNKPSNKVVGNMSLNVMKNGIPKISQSDIEYIISLYNEDKRVDIEVKANKWALDNADKTMETNSALNKGFKGGYNQCLQVNVDKKFTLEDMRKLWNDCRNGITIENEFNEYIKSFTKEQPNNNTLMVEYEYANGGYSNTNEPPPLIPKLKDNCIIIQK